MAERTKETFHREVRAAKIVQHLREEGRRIPATDIRVLFGYTGREIEQVLIRLSRSGLLDSKTARKGGYMITSEGRDADFSSVCLAVMDEGDWMMPLFKKWSGVSVDQALVWFQGGAR